ncbi:hypothetical protein CY35_02G048100 [Sphagnum magellanicum]|nr:hypothetical protein CY35_02G048100 [Sphagnum magellanicum]
MFLLCTYPPHAQSILLAHMLTMWEARSSSSSFGVVVSPRVSVVSSTRLVLPSLPPFDFGDFSSSSPSTSSSNQSASSSRLVVSLLPSSSSSSISGSRLFCVSDTGNRLFRSCYYATRRKRRPPCRKQREKLPVVVRGERNEGAEVGVCVTADVNVEQQQLQHDAAPAAVVEVIDPGRIHWNSADWEEFEKARRASVDSNQVSLDACNGAGAGGSSSLLHLGSIEDFSSFSPMTVTCIPAEEEEKEGPLLEMKDTVVVETQRKTKRIWRGPIRLRRVPPQPPWSEEDCRQRVETIINELLGAQREDSGSLAVTNLLDTWVGKITRVDLCNIIKELGCHHEGALAFEVFSWMQRQKRRLKPNGHTYSSIIGVLGRVGMVSRAREVFDSMLSSDIPVLVYSYNAMIGAYGRNGNFKKAWRLYEDMVTRGIHADEITFNTLLNAVGRAGLPIEKAEKLFLSMKHKGLLPSAQSYNTFLSVLSKAGHAERASTLIQEMCSTDATPNLVTYNTLLAMHAQTGKYKEGLEVYASLRAAGLEPNVVTFAGLIQLYSRTYKHQEAIDTFLEMKQSGCCPDSTIYSLMISVYGKAGLVEEAAHMFRQMQADGFKPNVVAWSSVIQAYGRLSMLQEVGKYYNEMLATGCQPDITLYNILLGAYGREGYSVQAAILFRKMIAQGVTPDAVSYNTMIQTYCKANQLADAESVYDQMTRAGFSPEKITRAALQQAGLKYTTENRIHLSRKERGVRWTPKLLRKL